MTKLTETFRPDESALKPGDLLWARGTSSTVYRGDEENPFSAYAPQAAREWEREKEGSSRTRDIEAMRFSSYRERYLGLPRATRLLGSTSRISTGHVAIVAFDAARGPLVVEASRHTTKTALPRSMQRLRAFGDILTYDAWLKQFKNPIGVWQGRLRGVVDGLPTRASEEAMKIAQTCTEASFSLFSFDLNDESAFYCGKFVWMATYRASGSAVGIDGDPNPSRSFPQWCSPLDIMKSSGYVELLFPPGTSPEHYSGRLGASG